MGTLGDRPVMAVNGLNLAVAQLAQPSIDSSLVLIARDGGAKHEHRRANRVQRGQRTEQLHQVLQVVGVRNVAQVFPRGTVAADEGFKLAGVGERDARLPIELFQIERLERAPVQADPIEGANERGCAREQRAIA